MTPVKKEGAM